MLVLSRKVGELIDVGGVLVKVISIQGGRVKIGIEAPRSIAVNRVERENHGKGEWREMFGDRQRAA